MEVSADTVATRLADIRDRIAAVGGGADGITVVAVTKDFGPDAVEAAVANGLYDCGENRAEQLVAKASSAAPTVRWHYLGRVQRNKVAALAPRVRLWQALDRAAAGAEIAKRAPGAPALVQVNVSGEPQKHGCPPAAVPAVVDDIRGRGLDVQGLMAVGPTGPPEAARPGFRLLRDLAERLSLPIRSMGMTDDLEVAVQEGSTMLRIGRGLFGDRPRPEGRDLRR
jgi:pyridoxal phosphate enzyme (YggS family)